MSAVLAQRNYDRELPVEVVAEGWTPLAQRVVTDDQVDQFIFDLADSGNYEDELGRQVTAPSLYLALAMEYRHGTLPAVVSSAFFAWAKSAAYIAEFGKPFTLPTMLQKQAGLK